MGNLSNRETTNLVEYVLQLVLSESATLYVLDRTEFLGHSFPIFLAHRLHLLLGKLLPNAGVISQICLGADDEAGYARAVVMNLGEPLLSNVLEGGGRCDAEAH